MEQRLERLERLVGPRIRQTREMQTPEGTRRDPSTRDGGSYGMLNIPGYDLGIISSHGGIPVFSSLALRWIQERTGDPNAFKAAYSAHASDSSAPPVRYRPGPELPSRTAVESCLALFSSSPLRLVWPVVDIDSFQQTIQLAYTSPETRLLEVRIAKLCVLVFVAFLSVLEPVHTSVVSLDPKACAKQARDSLLSVLDQPTVEGLQAAITLVSTRNFFMWRANAVPVNILWLFRGTSIGIHAPFSGLPMSIQPWRPPKAGFGTAA